MRSLTLTLMTSLFALALVAGCTSTPQQSTNNTVTTTPDCGTAATDTSQGSGANNTASQGVGNGACSTCLTVTDSGSGTDNSTATNSTDNSTTSTDNSTTSSSSCPTTTTPTTSTDNSTTNSSTNTTPTS